LATLLAVEGKGEEARGVLRGAGIPVREVGDNLLREAVVADRSGDLQKTAELLEAAVGLDPSAVMAWGGLVRARIALNELDQAEILITRRPQDGLQMVVLSHEALLAVTRAARPGELY
jgi:hypothetical protein